MFRWEGLAGVYASYRHSTMPCAASPYGVCIDQGLTQLMYMADRCFPALCAEPRFVEALLIPFAVQGQNIGTVWVVAHSDDRKFDAEDERIVRTLANFAAAGWQQWKAREAAACLPAKFTRCLRFKRYAVDAKQVEPGALLRRLTARSTPSSVRLRTSR